MRKAYLRPRLSFEATVDASTGKHLDSCSLSSRRLDGVDCTA